MKWKLREEAIKIRQKNKCHRCARVHLATSASLSPLKRSVSECFHCNVKEFAQSKYKSPTLRYAQKSDTFLIVCTSSFVWDDFHTSFSICLAPFGWCNDWLFWTLVRDYFPICFDFRSLRTVCRRESKFVDLGTSSRAGPKNQSCPRDTQHTVSKRSSSATPITVDLSLDSWRLSSPIWP